MKELNNGLITDTLSLMCDCMCWLLNVHGG